MDGNHMITGGGPREGVELKCPVCDSHHVTDTRECNGCEPKQYTDLTRCPACGDKTSPVWKCEDCDNVFSF